MSIDPIGVHPSPRHDERLPARPRGQSSPSREEGDGFANNPGTPRGAESSFGEADLASYASQFKADLTALERVAVWAETPEGTPDKRAVEFLTHLTNLLASAASGNLAAAESAARGLQREIPLDEASDAPASIWTAAPSDVLDDLIRLIRAALQGDSDLSLQAASRFALDLRQALTHGDPRPPRRPRPPHFDVSAPENAHPGAEAAYETLMGFAHDDDIQSAA